MKNHFNRAAGNHKNIYRKRCEDSMWEYTYAKKSWKLYEESAKTYSSDARIRVHKGFGDVIYATVRETFDDTPKPNPVTARATEIVNKAFAEALAESTTTARPGFFSRWFGRTP